MGPEDIIQKAVVQHLRARGVDGLVYFHVPNGGYRSRSEGCEIQGHGCQGRCSRSNLIPCGRLHCLELKSDKGRPSESQLEFLSDIERAGAFTAMPRGLNAAIATLEAWGLLRGVTT